jgi:hypothetical protein
MNEGNVMTGALKVVKGPTIYFLNEREECVGEKKEGINVSPTHYIRIQKGPVLFIPSHNEKVKLKFHLIVSV